MRCSTPQAQRLFIVMPIVHSNPTHHLPQSTDALEAIVAVEVFATRQQMPELVLLFFEGVLIDDVARTAAMNAPAAPISLGFGMDRTMEVYWRIHPGGELAALVARLLHLLSLETWEVARSDASLEFEVIGMQL